MTKIIGITGGVGAGKSQILKYISDNYNCRVILADQVANDIKLKGGICYEPLVKLLGSDVLGADGEIDKKKMAAKIFIDEKLLKNVNEILHPATISYIIEVVNTEKNKCNYDYCFIEAALLIECGFLKIVDEMWYIYAAEEVRRKRLKESRGYSDEKIDSILQKQLSEEEFRANCKVVIDNSGKLEDTYKQIDIALR
ncbi:MAG: dephospho-CoA kinase [Butyrivibrio sp.]|nr:dephospho-CoA kinase [Butyrivibrio sp.]